MHVLVYDGLDRCDLRGRCRSKGTCVCSLWVLPVDDALKHPYLAQYYRPEQVVTHANPFQYDLGFEQEEFDIPRIRQLIYEQSCIMNPSSAS